jgi:cell division protein FtsW (lipid II flippase)
MWLGFMGMTILLMLWAVLAVELLHLVNHCRRLSPALAESFTQVTYSWNPVMPISMSCVSSAARQLANSYACFDFFHR